MQTLQMPTTARNAIGALVLALALAACGGDGDTAAEFTGEVSDVQTTPLIEINANHVEPPVSFNTSPSTGGDHYPFWVNCGFYNEPVIEGAATHSLEHGVVWITYNASLAAEEISALEDLAASNPRLLISPYDHAEPIVLSAWGAQQRGISSASAPEVEAFITDWADNPVLGEAGASCSGAAGNPPNDPNTLVDGTPVPEEFLS